MECVNQILKEFSESLWFTIPSVSINSLTDSCVAELVLAV